MGAIELIVLGVLTVASFLTLGYWVVVIYHEIQTVALIPTARRGLGLPIAPEGQRPPRVCAIVPAHDEEREIADVARTVAEQDYPAGSLRCVFVLDRCNDDTRGAVERAWNGSA